MIVGSTSLYIYIFFVADAISMQQNQNANVNSLASTSVRIVSKLCVAYSVGWTIIAIVINELMINIQYANHLLLLVSFIKLNRVIYAIKTK